MYLQKFKYFFITSYSSYLSIPKKRGLATAYAHQIFELSAVEDASQQSKAAADNQFC